MVDIFHKQPRGGYMLDWEDYMLEPDSDEDFIALSETERNRKVKLCLLSDPDCEACQ